MSYRQLASDEEKLEENVMLSWEAFLYHIQDAMDFVNTQTPLITHNLEVAFQVSHYRQSCRHVLEWQTAECVPQEVTQIKF